MADKRHDPGGPPPRAPSPSLAAPASPATKKLRDRVSFFEKVWSSGTGSPTKERAGTDATDGSALVDVADIERRLREEQRKRQASGSPVIEVKLRHREPDYQETIQKVTEEGDLGAGVKYVKFEKIIVKKSVREVTTMKPLSRGETLSRTPSDERRTYEDSAYQSQSKSSSTSASARLPDDSPRSPHHTFQNMAARMEFVRSNSEYDTHIAQIRGLFLYTF